MENKLMSWIEAKLLPIANKIQRNKYLQAIQSAFMTCMPIMLVGSIVIILTRPWVDYTTLVIVSSMVGRLLLIILEHHSWF